MLKNVTAVNGLSARCVSHEFPARAGSSSGQSHDDKGGCTIQVDSVFSRMLVGHIGLLVHIDPLVLRACPQLQVRVEPHDVSSDVHLCGLFQVHNRVFDSNNET